MSSGTTWTWIDFPAIVWSCESLSTQKNTPVQRITWKTWPGRPTVLFPLRNRHSLLILPACVANWWSPFFINNLFHFSHTCNTPSTHFHANGLESHHKSKGKKKKIHHVTAGPSSVCLSVFLPLSGDAVPAVVKRALSSFSWQPSDVYKAPPSSVSSPPPQTAAPSLIPQLGNQPASQTISAHYPLRGAASCAILPAPSSVCACVRAAYDDFSFCEQADWRMSSMLGRRVDVTPGASNLPLSRPSVRIRKVLLSAVPRCWALNQLPPPLQT